MNFHGEGFGNEVEIFTTDANDTSDTYDSLDVALADMNSLSAEWAKAAWASTLLTFAMLMTCASAEMRYYNEALQQNGPFLRNEALLRSYFTKYRQLIILVNHIGELTRRLDESAQLDSHV